jgi:hypothetical protein
MPKYEVSTIPDDQLADARMAELGDRCEEILLGEDGEFDPARITVRRKSLCQFLGIGESTFTGWVQAGRIPRAAAIAFVLHRNLQERAQRIRRLTADRLEPRVVAIDGKFAVCEFVEKDGEIEGHLVASEIAEEAVARDIARHRSRAFADLQLAAVDELERMNEMDPDEWAWAGNLADKLKQFRKADGAHEGGES